MTAEGHWLGGKPNAEAKESLPEITISDNSIVGAVMW